MKQTTQAALASLRHKFQNKIKEVGQLKACLALRDAQIVKLSASLRQHKAVNFATAYGAATPASIQNAATVERLEAELRSTQWALGESERKQLTKHSDAEYKAVADSLTRAQNNLAAARNHIEKLENWALGWAILGVTSGIGLTVVGYKYAILTGLL